MAAITPAARSDLIALYLVMFGTAPTSAQLANMVTARENGSSLSQVATTLSVEAGFALVASKDIDAFALYLANSLLTPSTPAEARDWAINWTITQLQGTMTKAQVIAEAVQALRATDNPMFVDAQVTLNTTIENVIANLDASVNPITLDAAALAQVLGLFKLLFDAAPGFTLLKEAQTIVKSGLTIEGTRYEGMTGLADFLQTKVQASGGTAINSTSLVDLIFTNLHASTYLPAADVSTLKLALETDLNGSLTGQSVLNALTKLVSTVSTTASMGSLKDYLLASLAAGNAYSVVTTNTTTDTTVLVQKDEPALKLAAVATQTYTDTVADDSFVSFSGTLAGSYGVGKLTYGIKEAAPSDFLVTQTTPFGMLSLVPSRGYFEFLPNNAGIQAIKTNQSVQVELTVTDSASAPTTVSTMLTLNVVGADDPMAFGGTNSAVLPAGQLIPVSGTYKVLDRDSADAGFVPQSNVSGTGHHGSFSITRSGDWIYTPTDLAAGQSDSFPVVTLTGVAQAVTISMAGTEPPPSPL